MVNSYCRFNEEVNEAFNNRVLVTPNTAAHQRGFCISILIADEHADVHF